MSYAEHLIDNLDNLPCCESCGRPMYFPYPHPLETDKNICWRCYNKVAEAINAEAHDHAETVARPKDVQ